MAHLCVRSRSPRLSAGVCPCQPMKLLLSNRVLQRPMLKITISALVQRESYLQIETDRSHSKFSWLRSFGVLKCG